MTDSSLKSIIPDSISGMIFALEGLKNSVVLLNGPMGCRFYHSTTSQFRVVRPELKGHADAEGRAPAVDHSVFSDWFFRQERVPCTFLDGYDYVYGTKDKVCSALDYMAANVDFDVLAIVNSPGAALIGDDIERIARERLAGRRTVVLESSGYSDSFDEGCSLACLALLKQVGMPLWEERRKKAGAAGAESGSGQQTKPAAGDSEFDRRSVNLLGLNIWQRYVTGDIEELRRLFSLCGIDVNTVLLADCSLEDLARIPEADLNVVLYPETGLECAAYLKETLGTPYYVCDALPIGFSAAEKMFADICGMLGTSDEELRTESEKARALAWVRIGEISRSSGKPRGVRYYLDCGPSLEKAYSAFLTDYLGMRRSTAEDAELVFSNANVISELMLKNKTFCGIEISLPGMGYVDLVPKTHMGIKGALFLTEQVLNGLMSRI